MDPQQWQEEQEQIRRDFVAQLIERAAKDTYPSTTMLDYIEQTMGPDEAGDYARMLMNKIEQDNYPSFDLIDRLRGVVT
jgi:predicted nucleotide-binding protein (sugar kinase/HSP70/actin superfamily)